MVVLCHPLSNFGHVKFTSPITLVLFYGEIDITFDTSMMESWFKVSSPSLISITFILDTLSTKISLLLLSVSISIVFAFGPDSLTIVLPPLSMYGPTRTFIQFIKSYKMEYKGDIHFRDQYYTDKGAYYETRSNRHIVILSNNESKAIRKDEDST